MSFSSKLFTALASTIYFFAAAKDRQDRTEAYTNMTKDSNSQIIDLDVAVIGGGVAGLWLMNRLMGEGYNCALFENKALGSEQTIASQGMIHGGIKYTLGGALSKASESIADMPDYWQRCLLGEGDVDLQAAKVLSDHFYFWSSDSAASKMTTFLASKAVRGRVEKLGREDFPAVLSDSQFSGDVYQLRDIVLDVPSVVDSLNQNLKGRSYLLKDHEGSWRRDEKGNAELVISKSQETIVVRAKRFILTAGKGNQEILRELGIDSPPMQLRPLHQVWVKHRLPYHVFGHCLGADSTPRLSISTHPCSDGSLVWYLGGSIAEEGVNQSADDVISASKKEISELFPWLDFSDAQWHSLRVDRAEAKQRNFLRPDKAFIKAAPKLNNVLVAWPTKLTLVPNLANEALALLKKNKILTDKNSATETDKTSRLLQSFPQPPIAVPHWDK